MPGPAGVRARPNVFRSACWFNFPDACPMSPAYRPSLFASSPPLPLRQWQLRRVERPEQRKVLESLKWQPHWEIPTFRLLLLRYQFHKSLLWRGCDQTIETVSMNRKFVYQVATGGVNLHVLPEIHSGEFFRALDIILVFCPHRDINICWLAAGIPSADFKVLKDLIVQVELGKCWIASEPISLSTMLTLSLHIVSPSEWRLVQFWSLSALSNSPAQTFTKENRWLGHLEDRPSQWNGESSNRKGCSGLEERCHSQRPSIRPATLNRPLPSFLLSICSLGRSKSKV